MTESLIIIIPTVGAYCYAASKVKFRDDKIGIMLLFFAMFMLWMHFFVQGYKWFEPTLPEWLNNIRAYTSSLALPLSYMVVCHAIGKSKLTAFSVVLFLLPLANIVQYGAFSLDGTMSKEAVDMHNICILCNGKAIYRFPPYCFVMFIQSIGIFYRACSLSYMIGKSDYHASRQARLVLQLILALLLSIMVSAILPDGVWEYKLVKYLFFIYFAIGFTVLLVLIGKDFVDKPILDSNEEPAYIDLKPKVEDMIVKFNKLYDEEKIYLIPNLRIEDLAQRLGTNRMYTADMLKEQFGTSFAAYTNAKRVEEAKMAIITHPTEKFEDIAEKCGFATNSSFTKAFKNATGYTPSKWLARQLKGRKSKERTTKYTKKKQ